MATISKAQALIEFIDRLNLRYFKSQEIAAYATRKRGRVTNSLPPDALWPNVIPILVVADELRAQLGVPLTILSAYRSPAYNTAVGGEPGSYHMKFEALDLGPGDGDVRRLANLARKLRGTKFKVPGTNDSFTWKGGIGEYPKSGFVHIDCRGYNANW